MCGIFSPTEGYSFDTETITESGRAFRVQPVVYSTKLDSTGAFSGAPSSQTLILPFYVPPATLLFLLPIQKASIAMGKLSANHNCIGSYNAAGLDPANNCEPDSTHPQFVTGGSVTGFIALKDADAIVLEELGETICVVLSGNATKYGDGASPVTHCKVDSSKNIVFQGDWCSTTNKAAAAGCADAVQFSGKFAASSVHILNAPTDASDAAAD